MEEFTRINVAEVIDGKAKHFFRVDITGYNTNEQKRVFGELNKAFPAPNYKINVTRWNVVGHELDWAKENHV